MELQLAKAFSTLEEDKVFQLIDEHLASSCDPLIIVNELSKGMERVGKVSRKVIIGTVEGDIHDLGKNIVITLLECSGFEVIDLGVDVTASKFVDAVKDTEAELRVLREEVDPHRYVIRR